MYSPKKLIENLDLYLSKLENLISIENDTAAKEKLTAEKLIIEKYEQTLHSKDNLLAATDIQEGLKLEKHPEGGFFREFIRTKDYTIIFYLLPKGAVSSWHRLKDTEETFRLISGADLTIPKINNTSDWDSEKKVTYGEDIIIEKVEGEFGVWFGAYLKNNKDKYGLVTCTCKGPFEYEKFTMAKEADVTGFLEKNPNKQEVINKLTPKNHNNLIRSIIQFFTCCITGKKNEEQALLISNSHNNL